VGIFDEMRTGLKGLFGTSEALPSGNGVRFRSVSKGSVTLYSKDISDGNIAELAFDTKTISHGTGLSDVQVLAAVSALSCITGCPVKIHPKFKWPRVGLSRPEHVQQVLAGVARLFE